MPFRYTKHDQTQYVTLVQSPCTSPFYALLDARAHRPSQRRSSRTAAQTSLAVLLRRFPWHWCMYFGKRLVAYSNLAEIPIELSFKEGSSARGDLLVGAEGIKRVARATICADLASRAQYTAPTEALLKGVQPMWTRQYFAPEALSLRTRGRLRREIPHWTVTGQSTYVCL